MGSHKGVDDPYLMSLNLDEFLIGNKCINCSLEDCETLMKRAIICARESKMMPKPSSSSSSSPPPPIIHQNPNVWDDGMKNPNSLLTWENHAMPTNSGMIDDLVDFMQNQEPLMTKIDQEYLKWQQQEMMNPMLGSNLGVLEKGFEENKVVGLGDLDKMGVITTRVAEESADSERNGDEGMMAKSVERRQRRMIKNRESAARSRARKQAYINQLQDKVLRLQASNNLLRKTKEADKLLNSNSLPSPRYQLRRTTSFG